MPQFRRVSVYPDGSFTDSATHKSAGLPDPYFLDLDEVRDHVKDAGRHGRPINAHLSMLEIEWPDGARDFFIPCWEDEQDGYIPRSLMQGPLPGPVKAALEDIAVNIETRNALIEYAIHFGRAFADVMGCE